MNEDNVPCAFAKRNFNDAKKEFEESKSLKKNLEESLRNSGQKEKDEESLKNDILTEIRDKEKEIREAREKEQDTGRLEGERDNSVSKLRVVEGHIQDTRNFIDKTKAEHYTASGNMRKLISEMNNFRDEINRECSQDSRDDFDRTIPDFD